MKIALLNLPYDNNYGGNLQRYALMKILQDMGHDVTHINLRFHWRLPWYKMPYVYVKRVVKKLIIDHHACVFLEQKLNDRYEQLCKVTDPFYERDIKHTDVIPDLKQLSELNGFDAFVVGSDQVWRKTIANKYLKTMFLDFVPKNQNVLRIAYGVSLGSDRNELSEKEIHYLADLYKLFNAVSVREESALRLFDSYGWKNPKASAVLDPTLLLDKDDYIELINNSTTVPSKGNLFCYILDETKEKWEKIRTMEQELGLKAFEISLKGECSVSIEQWLRSFNDAEYVITDSYHGLLFSIIFRKPFYLFKNQYRGNARFDSVLDTFGFSADADNSEFDWNQLSNQLDDKRNQSLAFLSKVLCS